MEAGGMEETAGMEAAGGMEETAGMKERTMATAKAIVVKSGAIGNIISTILKTKSIFFIKFARGCQLLWDFDIIRIVNLLEIILLKLIEDNFIDPIIPTKKTKNA